MHEETTKTKSSRSLSQQDGPIKGTLWVFSGKQTKVMFKFSVTYQNILCVLRFNKSVERMSFLLIPFLPSTNFFEAFLH